jgi:hypothetical protein
MGIGQGQAFVNAAEQPDADAAECVSFRGYENGPDEPNAFSR